MRVAGSVIGSGSGSEPVSAMTLQSATSSKSMEQFRLVAVETARTAAGSAWVAKKIAIVKAGKAQLGSKWSTVASM